MLIIKPIQDKKYQEETASLCGFSYDPLQFAYSAKIDERLIASCQFDILGKRASITGFAHAVGEEEDLEALIILGRAVLNFMELSGAEICTFDTADANADRYAGMIGFNVKNGERVITLKGLFDSKCKHCEKP